MPLGHPSPHLSNVFFQRCQEILIVESEFFSRPHMSSLWSGGWGTGTVNVDKMKAIKMIIIVTLFEMLSNVEI